MADITRPSSGTRTSGDLLAGTRFEQKDPASYYREALQQPKEQVSRALPGGGSTTAPARPPSQQPRTEFGRGGGITEPSGTSATPLSDQQMIEMKEKALSTGAVTKETVGAFIPGGVPSQHFIYKFTYGEKQELAKEIAMYKASQAQPTITRERPTTDLTKGTVFEQPGKIDFWNMAKRQPTVTTYTPLTARQEIVNWLSDIKGWIKSGEGVKTIVDYSKYKPQTYTQSVGVGYGMSKAPIPLSVGKEVKAIHFKTAELSTSKGAEAEIKSNILATEFFLSSIDEKLSYVVSTGRESIQMTGLETKVSLEKSLEEQKIGLVSQQKYTEWVSTNPAYFVAYSKEIIGTQKAIISKTPKGELIAKSLFFGYETSSEQYALARATEQVRGQRFMAMPERTFLSPLAVGAASMVAGATIMGAGYVALTESGASIATTTAVSRGITGLGIATVGYTGYTMYESVKAGQPLVAARTGVITAMTLPLGYAVFKGVAGTSRRPLYEVKEAYTFKQLEPVVEQRMAGMKTEVFYEPVNMQTYKSFSPPKILLEYQYVAGGKQVLLTSGQEIYTIVSYKPGMESRKIPYEALKQFYGQKVPAEAQQSVMQLKAIQQTFKPIGVSGTIYEPIPFEVSAILGKPYTKMTYESTQLVPAGSKTMATGYAERYIMTVQFPEQPLPYRVIKSEPPFPKTPLSKTFATEATLTPKELKGADILKATVEGAKMGRALPETITTELPTSYAIPSMETGEGVVTAMEFGRVPTGAVPKSVPISISKVTPTFFATTAPMVRPGQKPMMTPMVTPMLSPMMTPMVTPTVTPALTPMLSPMLSPMVTPALTPMLSPMVTPKLSPVVTPVVTPVLTPTAVPKTTFTWIPTTVSGVKKKKPLERPRLPFRPRARAGRTFVPFADWGSIMKKEQQQFVSGKPIKAYHPAITPSSKEAFRRSMLSGSSLFPTAPERRTNVKQQKIKWF